MRQLPVLGIIARMSHGTGQPAESTRRIPRVTLGRFFVVLTVLTLIASHAWTVKQLYSENKRLNELHRRFGIARVVDREEPAAQRLYLSSKNIRFHVIQPHGKRYRICGSLSNVNQWTRDFPAPEFSLETPDVDEFILFVSYYEKVPATELGLELRWSDGSFSRKVPVPEHHYLDLLTHNGMEGRSSFYADSHYDWAPKRPWNNQKAPLLLLAIGEQEPYGYGKSPPGRDGLILWVEALESPTTQ